MSAELQGPNAGYVAQLLEDYLDAPASVPPDGELCSSGTAPSSGRCLDCNGSSSSTPTQRPERRQRRTFRGAGGAEPA